MDFLAVVYDVFFVGAIVGTTTMVYVIVLVSLFEWQLKDLS